MNGGVLADAPSLMVARGMRHFAYMELGIVSSKFNTVLYLKGGGEMQQVKENTIHHQHLELYNLETHSNQNLFSTRTRPPRLR